MPKSHKLVAALRRPRWSAGDARTVLGAVDRSGLSIAAFAAREGLDVQRLYTWRRRLRVEQGAAPAFVEVRATSGSREAFEVVLASGRVLRVPASFDASVLRQLLEVLESC